MYSTMKWIAVVAFIMFLNTAVPAAAQTIDFPQRVNGADPSRNAKAEFAGGLEELTTRSSDNIDAVSYTLTIALDFDNQSIEAVCDVDVRSTQAGLTEFALDLVDLTVTGVVEDGTQAVSYTHDGEELRITPSSPMSIGQERVYSISYEGQPTRGLHITDDNGGVAYTHSQPENARCWYPCRDIPSDKADWYRGHITAPSQFTAVSNGELQGTVDNGDGTSTTSYFLDYPVSSYLVSLAVSDYRSFQQTAPSGIPITYFVYPDLYDLAVYDWENVPAMFDFYESVFEAYPFSTYGMVVAPFGGAMENQTMTTWTPNWITGDRTYEGTVAHELAHQWWGDLVTCATWADIWLNEGFATYFDALFTEHFYGELAFYFQMNNDRWAYFNGEAYFEGRFPIYDPEFMWGNTVYQKGGWILHMIRSIVGYETFVEICREWADRYRYDAANTEQFIAVVEDVTGEDWDWFFDQWVYMAGYPEYRMDWTTSAGNLYLTVEQIQELDDVTPLFDMPLEVLIQTPAGDVRPAIRVDRQIETFVLNVPAEPTRVVLDPDHEVLCRINGLDGWAVAPGPASTNSCAVRCFNPFGVPLGPEITPYGVDRYGAYVGAGDVNGDGFDEILTGPGPGNVFGPHVRGWDVDGTPLPGLSFLAYGTNRWGVKVAAGDIDGDGFDEVITGAGPGAVFGPHVRAFDYDGTGPITPVPGVSYFAYGTHRWGVNVSAGDIDGDGFDEVITGAGPGSVFGPHVRGWNVDGGGASAIPAVSFFAYGTPRWGANVACGDFDADGIDEIVTAPGPGPTYASHIRAFNYDGTTVAPMDDFNFFISVEGFGATVSAADMNGDGPDEILVGPGPHPEAPAIAISVTLHHGGWLESHYYFEAFPGMTAGTNIAGGRFPMNGRQGRTERVLLPKGY